MKMQKQSQITAMLITFSLKDQEELRDKVDEQLKELKKDGTLSKLSQKYFGQDTAPEDDQFEKTPN